MGGTELLTVEPKIWHQLPCGGSSDPGTFCFLDVQGLILKPKESVDRDLLDLRVYVPTSDVNWDEVIALSWNWRTVPESVERREGVHPGVVAALQIALQSILDRAGANMLKYLW
eukprot:scaffold259468_cov16-Prasinocladus_malaysianus.AAC.2